LSTWAFEGGKWSASFSNSITPRYMVEWRYSSNYCQPGHLREVSGQLHSPTAFSQKKSHCYLLNRRLGGPQSQFGCFGKETISYHCWESNQIPQTYRE